MKYRIVFLILCVSIFPEMKLVAAKTCIFTHAFSVHVVNKLPDPLKLHCQSKDDNLGNLIIKTSNEYSWSFCNHLFDKTLFSCQLWWGDKDVAFKAFTSGSSDYNCIEGKCTWEARTDGIYASVRYLPTFKKMYDWNKKAISLESKRSQIALRENMNSVVVLYIFYLSVIVPHVFNFDRFVTNFCLFRSKKSNYSRNYTRDGDLKPN